MTKSTAPANTEQLEMDQMAEIESDRLHKQLRKMEKDRILFLDEKKNAMAKRERLLDTLKRERQRFQDRLMALHHGPHARNESKAEKKIQQLLRQKEVITRAMDEQKMQMWELNGHIKKVEKQIQKLHENQSAQTQYSEQIDKGRNDIRKLENQLDVVNKRCGDVMSENTNLRAFIDHLLLERTHFNAMWEKMVTKLDHGKKHILELIEQSVAAYDQREELCHKIQNLNEKSQNETHTHMQEMRELQRRLDHDAKLQQFFAIKGNRRINAELEIRETNRRLVQQEQTDQQVHDLQNILDQIQILSGEKNVEKYAAYFTKQEEENFALFNYVNELSYEVEVLNEAVQRVQDDIDKQKIENETKVQTQRDSTIEVLEEQLNLCAAKEKNAEAIHLECEKRLYGMLSGIENLFSLLNCGQAPILNLLSSHNDITIYNVKIFLGIVKRRTNQIINCLNYTDQPSKILAKRDRVPKFNIKDVSSAK